VIIDKKERIANKLLEIKFTEMANKNHMDFPPEYDEKFIERMRKNDYWMEGPNFIEKFEKINNKIDNLKMKGFKIIVQHEESKKKRMPNKKSTNDSPV
jgi:hypothetical protein